MQPSQTLIVAALSLALGAAVGALGLLGVGAFLAFVVVILAFAFPRKALYVLIIAAVGQYVLTRMFPVLPQPAVLLDDAIALGIVARLAADMALSRVRPPFWLVAPLGAFLVVGVVSSALNSVGIEVAVNAIRAVALPTMLMPAAAVYLEGVGDRARMVSVILAVCFVNAALSVGQWLTDPARVDIATGLLGPGGANGSGFLSLLGLVLAFVAPSSRRWRLLAVGVLGTGLLVSSARAAIVAAPAALLSAGWRRAGGTKARRVAAVALVAVLTIGLGYYYQLAGRDIQQDISPTVLVQGQTTAGQGGRLLYLFAVPSVWNTSDLGPLVGIGAGSYTSFVGMNRLAPAFVAQARVRSDSLIGFAYPDMQWTALLGEYGLTGTVFAALCFLWPLLRIRRCDVSLLVPGHGSMLMMMPALFILWVTGMSAINLMEYGPVAVPMWVLVGTAAGAVLRRQS